MIKVGIIGLGIVGKRLLQQFLEHKDTKIVAICDVDNALLKEIANICPNVTTYQDYRQLVQDSNVELVYIAVPPSLHLPIAKEAISCKKHILCEKPMANNLEEAIEMATLAKKSNVIHALHFPLPYSCPVAAFKQKLQDGFIGKLRRINLTMHFDEWPRSWQKTEWVGKRKQGGFIREITPHYIQLIHNLFGPIESINSQIEFPINDDESETSLLATMKLNTGQSIFIDGLTQIAKREKISFIAYGTTGTLALENWRILKAGKNTSNLLEIDPKVDVPYDLLSSLVNSIYRGKSQNLITFEDGLEVQRVLEAIRHPNKNK